MTITTAEVPTTELVVTGYTCDSCGKKWNGNDWGEVQEMLHWENRGGYGSVFGDGADMTLDLCQDCIKTRLGDCIQFHEEID